MWNSCCWCANSVRKHDKRKTSRQQTKACTLKSKSFLPLPLSMAHHFTQLCIVCRRRDGSKRNGTTAHHGRTCFGMCCRDCGEGFRWRFHRSSAGHWLHWGPELVEKENTLAAEKAETATVGVPNLASTQAQEVSTCVEGDFLSLCPLSTRLRDLLCYGKTKLPAERPGLRWRHHQWAFPGAQ